ELTRMSMELLEKTPADLRQYNALMFTVSPRGFTTVKERIRSFLEELREILDRDRDEDRIYSLTLQLFPNSRLPASGDGASPVSRGGCPRPPPAVKKRRSRGPWRRTRRRACWRRCRPAISTTGSRAVAPKSTTRRSRSLSS